MGPPPPIGPELNMEMESQQLCMMRFMKQMMTGGAAPMLKGSGAAGLPDPTEEDAKEQADDGLTIDQVPCKLGRSCNRLNCKKKHAAGREIDDDPTAYERGMVRFAGVIKSFDPVRGFGFIASKEVFNRYKRDVYIHRTQIGTRAVG